MESRDPFRSSQSQSMRTGNDTQETVGLGTTAEEGKREAWEGEEVGKSGVHHARKPKGDTLVRRSIWFPVLVAADGTEKHQ